jgi:predicted RNA binding protein YcfA (HicA-like mRNA interferase family)
MLFTGFTKMDTKGAHSRLRKSNACSKRRQLIPLIKFGALMSRNGDQSAK